MPTSNKGKKKEAYETVPKKRPYLTRGTIKKLIEDAMKESKLTSIGRKLRKAKVVKNQVSKANVIVSKDIGKNKRIVRVSHNGEVKRIRK